MPPRHAYWTILVDEQPTAFRAALLEDLQPTFKRLKEKHPSARVVWFQNGKVWNSRLDAQEAMRARGEMGRRGDVRQRPQFNGGETGRRPKLEWKPKGAAGTSSPQALKRPGPPLERGKLEWKPRDQKFAAEDRPRRDAAGKLEWKPKGAPGTALRPQDPRTPRPSRANDSGERRTRAWRPGGEHRDPRQKYKDAKKAKWSRFKQTIRKRWESKQGKKKDDK